MLDARTDGWEKTAQEALSRAPASDPGQLSFHPHGNHPVPSPLNGYRGVLGRAYLSLHASLLANQLQFLLEEPCRTGYVLAVLGLAVLPFDSSVDEPLTLFLFPLEGEQQVLGRSGAVSSGPWCANPCSTWHARGYGHDASTVPLPSLPSAS